jgi:hypothetical protein
MSDPVLMPVAVLLTTGARLKSILAVSFHIYIVTCLLKTRTVKPAETVVVRERISKHARCWTMTQQSSRYGRNRHARNRKYAGRGVFCAVRAETI